MYAPIHRSAQALQTRVESSILDGTWKQAEVLSAQWCTKADGHLMIRGHLWGQPNTYTKH